MSRTLKTQRHQNAWNANTAVKMLVTATWLAIPATTGLGVGAATGYIEDGSQPSALTVKSDMATTLNAAPFDGRLSKNTGDRS